MGCYEVNQTMKLETATPTLLPLTVFPNPSDGNSTVQYELKQAAFVQVDLLNASGQLEKTLIAAFQNAGTTQLQLSAEDLTAGLYFVQIKMNGKLIGTMQWMKN